MSKTSQRCAWAAGLALALAPLAAHSAPAPGEARDLVRRAFTETEPRYLISFNRYCTLEPNNTATGAGAPAAPSKLFDNLYYVGRTDVGAWVIKTSAGLILIDTLYSPDDAQNVIEAGMRKLGLDPGQIKLILLTHFHTDHTGGWKYFHAKGIKVMASEKDWGPLGGAPDPDSVLRDGQDVRLGDTTLRILLIPGHTPGTIAAIFPVSDHGKRHTAVLTGGIGPRGGIDMQQTSLASLMHLAEATRPAGVDVFLDPHEAIIDSTAWGVVADPAARKPGAPNELVISPDRFQRMLSMLMDCTRARIILMQQPKPAAR
jgi:metallo-beta-lactamase class B